VCLLYKPLLSASLARGVAHDQVTPMKITYFTILLAATILSRNVVAQEETPTPPAAPNSRIEPNQTDLKKKPRPVYESGEPKFQHLTTPTPYRPHPDTTLRPFNPGLKKKPTPIPTPRAQEPLNAPSTVSATRSPTPFNPFKRRFRPSPNTTLNPHSPGVTPTPPPTASPSR
jgi:hypothetical protein